MKNPDRVKDIVKKSYAEIAQSAGGCCSSSCGCGSDKAIQKQTQQIRYSKEEMSQAPGGSNLGLGCGNPVAIASLKEGEVVLDLGSGAGFDAFLAAKKVGKTGRVIGVDMTEEMIERAREHTKEGGFGNVEFRKGDIEDLPLKDNSVDVVISNCVINLAPNKEKVFKEACRVLKQGGRLMVSDIVLTKPLPKELKENEESLVGCVSGAVLKGEYLELIKKAGFSNIKIYKETPFYPKDYTASITFSAVK